MSWCGFPTFFSHGIITTLFRRVGHHHFITMDGVNSENDFITRLELLTGEDRFGKDGALTTLHAFSMAFWFCLGWSVGRIAIHIGRHTFLSMNSILSCRFIQKQPAP